MSVCFLHLKMYSSDPLPDVLSPSWCPVWYFLLCPLTSEWALNLPQWRPPVLAYKTDRRKNRAKWNGSFLFSPLLSLCCGEVNVTTPHRLLTRRSEYKRVRMDTSVPLWTRQPAVPQVNTVFFSFSSSSSLVIPMFAAVSLCPVSSAQPLSLIRSTASILRQQHTPVSCFMIYIVHIFLPVGLQNLWHKSGMCVSPLPVLPHHPF